MASTRHLDCAGMIYGGQMRPGPSVPLQGLPPGVYLEDRVKQSLLSSESKKASFKGL